MRFPAVLIMVSPAFCRLATVSNHSAFDGCLHVFLDIGSNVGIQLMHLYEPSSVSSVKSHLQPAFNKLFGKDQSDRANVCAFAIEPNAHHSSRLQSLRDRYTTEFGARISLLTETAAGNKDGRTAFYIDSHPVAKKFNEVGSSLMNRGIEQSKPSGSWTRVEVAMVDLAQLLKQALSRRTPRQGRRLPLSQLPPAQETVIGASADLRPAVVMKLDVEGAEFEILSRLLATGTLCELDAIFIEFHPHIASAHSTRDAQALSSFQSVLDYVRAHAGDGCKVHIRPLAGADLR